MDFSSACFPILTCFFWNEICVFSCTKYPKSTLLIWIFISFLSFPFLQQLCAHVRDPELFLDATQWIKSIFCFCSFCRLIFLSIYSIFFFIVSQFPKWCFPRICLYFSSYRWRSSLQWASVTMFCLDILMKRFLSSNLLICFNLFSRIYPTSRACNV